VLPMRPELLKGHLDALLLAMLEPGHSTDTPSSRRSGPAATVHSTCPRARFYPVLHRLERAGPIRSDWHTVGGRRRTAVLDEDPESCRGVGVGLARQLGPCRSGVRREKATSWRRRGAEIGRPATILRHMLPLWAALPKLRSG
jgi:hypothetical protein